VFEHFYDDCVFGSDVSTHYIVLGYEVKLEIVDMIFQQHNLWKWMNSHREGYDDLCIFVKNYII
jgi:colanic acid biosynthesis protein WcaH